MALDYTNTRTLRLYKPNFRSPDWSSQHNINMDTIDTAIRNLLMDVVPWDYDTFFDIGQVVVDTDNIPPTYWINNVAHNTPSIDITFGLREDGGFELREDDSFALRETGGTFIQERQNFPLYWTSFSFGLQPRGAWTNDTVFFSNDIAYDSVLGITGISKFPHTSNHGGTIVDDVENWDFIVNLPTVFLASAVRYDNSSSHLAATNAQAAIDAIHAEVAGAFVAANVTYNNAGTGLVAASAQSAITELKTLHDTDAGAIAANTAAIAAGLIGTGFPHWRPTSETLPGWIIGNGTSIGSAASAATQRNHADCVTLFAWFWNNFSNTDCPVSGGRGANAAADFAANKTIGVLDMKGTGNVGVDTMGALATTRLAGVPIVSGGPTIAGSVLGENIHILTLGEAPIGITSNGNNSISVVSTISTIFSGGVSDNYTSVAGAGTWNTPTRSSVTSTNPTQAIAVTSNNTSGGAHNTRGRDRAGYWYFHL